VVETNARTAFTRPRRSRSLRSAVRSSASRESSGRKLSHGYDTTALDLGARMRVLSPEVEFGSFTDSTSIP